MREVVLFDGDERQSLLPLTYMRAVSQCRVGLLTIQEKWSQQLPASYHIKTVDYLQGLYASSPDASKQRIWINGSVLPNEDLVASILLLKANEVLIDGDDVVAFFCDEKKPDVSIPEIKQHYIKVRIASDRIVYPEDILEYCDQEFRKDFLLITKGQESQIVGADVRCRGKDIFIHPSATVYDCILNATDGPIYIGADAEVMEQAVIKGPVGVGANSAVHVGAKVYAHTMLGPFSKIGGEIKRTTVFGYSNKAHEGYLGDSVIGQWCNIGADTNNSNMKNTYGKVSLWTPEQQKFRTTKRQFLGLIMADHTMSAINTAFMTGSVTGVFANVFGANYPSRWSPSFTWGRPDRKYDFDRACTVATRAMNRRNILLTEAYKKALKHVSER
ncbi:MAG: UDP-N-acetylglucosamine diphosphorylase/glucosamine-1-phosphate N-acetyltransferase [Saprospiraceae bacterium]|jgi:UDP-N-acetylglucosamine diphosphorylase/glucosamine-1-phosphate N-acetyltransferase